MIPHTALIDAEVERGEGGLHARVAGTALPLPVPASSALGAGARIRLGLRPKHISIASSDDRDAIPGSVYSHEMVGRELQLLIQVEGGWLRFRTRDRLAVRAGDPLPVRLDLAQARLFDHGTGHALTAG